MSTYLSIPTISSNWLEANQYYLIRAISHISEALQHHIHQVGDAANSQEMEQWKESRGFKADSENFGGDRENFHYPTTDSSELSALEQVCNIFDLSLFERNVLLLCAGREFDRSWSSLFAKAQGDQQQNYPTFSLALEVLAEAHWSALLPSAPLRRWRLIEVGAGNTLTTNPLRIDERILHHLMGVQHLDERLAEIELSVPVNAYLVSSHEYIAQQLADTWLQALDETEILPVLQLCGTGVASKPAIASTACTFLGLSLYAISAETIPTDTNQLNLIKCLCEREWMLSDRVLLLDCDQLETMEASRNSAISRFIETINCPLIITSCDRLCQKQRPLITFDVHQPTSEEQQLIWQNALGKIAPSFQGHVETLVSHFSLSPTDIQTASLRVKSLVKKIEGQRDKETEKSVASTSPYLHLWDICRNQARPRLDELAQRIEPSASWNDLVLPEKEQRILHEIAAHVAQRTKVYKNWGFGSKSGRGLGISALFSGASGTGKTTAAELLARELRLDLYRIDLSSIVNKYIGETEKNLRRVFDAAETGGVILLFDEADALFGKRSEVKDSHDRYANMEVSYLLQRIESYHGLAILTTNLKSSIDQAFLRRLRFVVQFSFPDAKQRAEIWQRILPSQTPTEGLDFTKLAQLSVTGGNIRNIALNAAFIAANSGESLGMKHILQATKNEYIKLERSLTDAEIKSWV
ncbi:ATP-binding protein [Nostoc sp. FACHB-133]|uniref:ATP-binding protein n=1 Tax=Nostoc sp. FACHB-133 TaxID=2692835 RepID=UPI001688ECAD|nr:ATP-binding protein [Nostoc sp. FACHB-133]MBD2527837.1 ATP-binding protein [Nostoc sp. FACHB-133]